MLILVNFHIYIDKLLMFVLHLEVRSVGRIITVIVAIQYHFVIYVFDRMFVQCFFDFHLFCFACACLG